MGIIARWLILIAVAGAGIARSANADDPQQPLGLTADLKAAIDKEVVDALADTGAPSACIAVVKDAKLVYRRAYGLAKIKPAVPAVSSMRYRIGSIGKQFVAAAVLMLVEEQKLSLDDKVDKFFPDMTRAGEVTIRQLLSMTAGYQDYWPQDYLLPSMLNATTPQEIIKQWGHKPLDFEPGSKWQYSNTNYVIAGLIVEKASGMPLFEFLQKRIFKPLEMDSVADASHGALGEKTAEGYRRYGLGPLRAAPTDGAGWLFASSDLAMTAAELALWDIGVIEKKLLKPESYRAMQTEVQTTGGTGTLYGLGVGVRMADEHRQIWHDGMVSGFTSQNYIFPDDRAAIVVLTNMDGTGTAERIAMRLSAMIVPSEDPQGPAAAKQARQILEGLQRGKIDKNLFTANAGDYFSQQALDDLKTSMGTLGPIVDFGPIQRNSRGGMILRRYRVRFVEKIAEVSVFVTSEGKIDQYLVTPAE